MYIKATRIHSFWSSSPFRTTLRRQIEPLRRRWSWCAAKTLIAVNNEKSSNIMRTGSAHFSDLDTKMKVRIWLCFVQPNESENAEPRPRADTNPACARICTCFINNGRPSFTVLFIHVYRFSSYHGMCRRWLPANVSLVGITWLTKLPWYGIVIQCVAIKCALITVLSLWCRIRS